MQHLLARVLLIALATTAQKNNAGTELAKCTARATEDVILFVDDYITKGIVSLLSQVCACVRARARVCVCV